MMKCSLLTPETTAFKCCPPVREVGNRELLWEGLIDGTIDFIVSDHSPSTPEEKGRGDGDLQQAWGGISGLQVGSSANPPPWNCPDCRQEVGDGFEVCWNCGHEQAANS